MNWDALGAVSEALAAVGVIITLVYLAIQIRISNRTSTAVAFQALAGKAQDRLLAVASSPELAGLFGKSFDELDDTQKNQARFFMFALVQDLHDQFRQHELGMVDHNVLFGALNRIHILDSAWDIIPSHYMDLSQNWAPSFATWFGKHWKGRPLT